MEEFNLKSVAIVMLAAVLSFVASFYWHRRKDEDFRDSRIQELEKQIAVITAAVVPISTAFQEVLVKELTHYHTSRFEELANNISAAEAEELIRDAVKMLPMVKKRAKIEAIEPKVVVAESILQIVPTLDQE